MSKKTVYKLLLDLAMTGLYLLLMFADEAGAFFHEAAGIGIGVLFALHVLLNRRSLAGMLRARKKCARRGKPAFLLLLDLLLTVGMPVVILTGVLISQVLFDTGITGAWMTIFTIHNAASYFCLAVLALHLAAHAKYLATAAGAAVRQYRSSNVRKAAGRFAAGTLAACFVYVLSYTAYKNSLDTAFIQNISPVTEIKTSVAEANSTSAAESTATAESTAAPESTETTESAQAAEETENAAASEDEKAKTTATDTPATSTATVTLGEFLSKLYCTGCHNHCPLSNPLCARSAEQVEQATAEYYDTYSVSAE